MRYPLLSRRILLLAVLLGMLGIGALLLRTSPPVTPTAAPSPARADLARQSYVSEPGAAADAEANHLLSMDSYWNSRVTYPTGRFDRRWLIQAAAQDRAHVSAGVPAGRVVYDRARSQAPLALDPTQWTPIGPQPQNSNTCQAPCFTFGLVAGRTNSIVVDPISPTIAYMASDGGGVWKSSNCCTPLTTWAAVTDDPLLSTVAVDDLTIDSSNHANVYAATGDLSFGSFSFGSAGILKSTDQGATWTVKGASVFGPYYPEPAGQFPQYNAVGKVRVDPRNSNTLVAGAKTGVYLSYDGGNNWTNQCVPDAFPNERQDITALLVHTNTLGTDLYVAVGTRGYSTTVQTNLAENGANGIYKTTLPASGCPASWSLISTPLNGWPVGTGSGIPVYQTGGNPLGRIDLVMAPGNPSVIYAQVQAILPGVGGGLQRGGQMGLWRTTDGGTTWHEQSTAATLNADVCPNSLVGGDYPQNWYDQGIAVDPNNPTTLYMDTFEIWKSTDAGVSFSDTTCGYGSLNAPAQVHVDQHALAYLPGSSSTMLAGSDGGSYVTLTADQPQPVYNQLNSSLSTIEFYSGDLVANFANAAVQQANAGAQDNGSSVWNGDPSHLWSQRLGGDGFFARIEPLLGQRWYFESQNGGLNVSTSGPNGPLIAASGAWSSDRLSFIFPYEIYKNDCAPTGCDHLIAGSYRVWETTQGAVPASSWYINSPDLTKGTLADRSFINQLSYAVSLSTTAIVGTNDGNVQYGFGLGQGSANTATWVNVTGSNSVLPNRPILDVATDPLTPTSGYAAVGGFDENTPATPGHVFLVTCTANCATFTWANKTGNLPDIPVDTIIANPLYRQQVFAGTDWGVYYTNNIDAPTPQWFRFAAGMPSTMVWDFQIDRGFTTLAAFTRSRGAFVWPLPAGPFGGTPTPTVTGTPPTATMTSTPRPSNTPLPPVTPSATVSPTRTASPTATATPLGCGASQLLSEGFESGTLGVFTATTTIGAERWVVVSGTANSGIYSAFASDPNEQSDQQLALLTPLAIPAGAITATLHFAHRYSFEQPGYDGGVLESSTNGVVWTDAGANILQGGYTGVITATGGNPLSGRAAWINQSPGYPSFTGVTVNLLPYSGQSVQFRFRLGSDLNGVAPGWWVDDVSVIAGLPCGSATPTPPPRPTQTPGGPTATPQPTQTPGGPTATPAPPTASSTPCALSFTDVHPTDYFYTPVLYLACHGVISGYSNGDGTYSFRPYNNTTRSQMVKIVVLGFNKAIVTPAPGAYTFTDVPPSNPFFAVIETAARNNIVSGYTCGGPNEPCDSANRPYFRPYTNVTRGQLSKIDVVAAGWALRNPPAGSFTDVLPGTAFYEFVETAYCHGVISGYTCGGVGEPCDNQNRPYFRQYNQATRGQIAKIVYLSVTGTGTCGLTAP